jgi:hypothetical protein
VHGAGPVAVLDRDSFRADRRRLGGEL